MPRLPERPDRPGGFYLDNYFTSLDGYIHVMWQSLHLVHLYCYISWNYQNRRTDFGIVAGFRNIQEHFGSKRRSPDVEQGNDSEQTEQSPLLASVNKTSSNAAKADLQIPKRNGLSN